VAEETPEFCFGVGIIVEVNLCRLAALPIGVAIASEMKNFILK
jgi:hypothetical protein